MPRSSTRFTRHLGRSNERMSGGRCVDCFFAMRTQLPGKAIPIVRVRHGADFRAGLHADAVVIIAMGISRRQLLISRDTVDVTARLHEYCRRPAASAVSADLTLARAAPTGPPR